MSFTGKVSLVTGSSRGIGRAIAIRLGQEGSSVIVNYNTNIEAANEVVSQIRASGSKAIAVKADITKSEDVDRLVQSALDEFGKIDLLVNNAGGAILHYFIDGDEETWRKIIDLDFWSVLIVTKAVLKNMIQNKSGNIVNISSEAGRVGIVKEVVYSACKAAVMGATRALAKEVARYNIRVNCVCPGLTETPMSKDLAKVDPERNRSITASIPMRRAGTPEEIAEVVLFLASEKSSYITGQSLGISGGMIMI